MSPSPIEIETSGDDTVKVDYGGRVYEFPATLDDADGDVLEAVDDMKLSRAIRGLLSVDDYTAFKATKPKVRDYAALFDAYAVVIGLSGAGE